MFPNEPILAYKRATKLKYLLVSQGFSYQESSNTQDSHEERLHALIEVL